MNKKAKEKIKVGRPAKYHQLLEFLDDDELYTPASIVHLAEKRGLLRRFLKKEPDVGLADTRLVRLALEKDS